MLPPWWALSFQAYTEIPGTCSECHRNRKGREIITEITGKTKIVSTGKKEHCGQVSYLQIHRWRIVLWKKEQVYLHDSKGQTNGQKNKAT